MRHASRRTPVLLGLLLLTGLWPDVPPAAGQETITARVLRVIDGDTIQVRIGERTELVRYIGINTPEIHHPTRGKEPYGEAAREVNRRLVEGKSVLLVFDVQKRDPYARLLAYVFVDGQHVNAELVFRGYAEAATFPPNVRHAAYYRELQRSAREAKRGLWADAEALQYHQPAKGTVEAEASKGSSSSPSAGSAPSSGSSSSSATTAPGKDVNVRGYSRKDGTYVPPHTRSAPTRSR